MSGTLSGIALKYWRQFQTEQNRNLKISRFNGQRIAGILFNSLSFDTLQGYTLLLPIPCTESSLSEQFPNYSSSAFIHPSDRCLLNFLFPFRRPHRVEFPQGKPESVGLRRRAAAAPLQRCRFNHSRPDSMIDQSSASL